MIIKAIDVVAGVTGAVGGLGAQFIADRAITSVCNPATMGKLEKVSVAVGKELTCMAFGGWVMNETEKTYKSCKHAIREITGKNKKHHHNNNKNYHKDSHKEEVVFVEPKKKVAKKTTKKVETEVKETSEE